MNTSIYAHELHKQNQQIYRYVHIHTKHDFADNLTVFNRSQLKGGLWWDVLVRTLSTNQRNGANWEFTGWFLNRSSRRCHVSF